MKNIFILLVLCILPYFLNAETNATANFSHKDKVYHYLKEELKAGYSLGGEAQAMEMDRAYFSVVGEELRRHLKKSGFRFLDQKIFKNKVKNILNLNEKRFIHKSNYDYVSTVALPFASDLLTFLPDKGLITFPYKMPEIIDYQKDYPELAKFEDSVNTAYNNKSGYKKHRVPWKGRHDDHTKFTKNNIAYVIALNKYLLNDDFSQRSWLVENTYSIIYNLYAFYGYKEDKGLLKVLLKTEIEGIQHKSLEWYDGSSGGTKRLYLLPQKVEGQYVVREEAFKHLSELIKDEEEEIIQYTAEHGDLSPDGELYLLYVNRYLYTLEKFVEHYEKDEAYKSAVEDISAFIKNETPSKPN